MTDRWLPAPRASDGADGRGESGPSASLATRRETEVLAATGRVSDDGQLRDPSNPIEPADREAVEQDLPETSPESPTSGW